MARLSGVNYGFLQGTGLLQGIVAFQLLLEEGARAQPTRSQVF